MQQVATVWNTFKYAFIHTFLLPTLVESMSEIKRKHRTIYIVTAALMVAMIGGYALAATTVTTLSPGQSSNVTNTPAPGGFTNIGTIVSEQLIILSAAMTGSATAGAQIGTVGLDGTPTALAVCGAAPCAAQNFRTANPATETTGDYGEQFVVNVIQPATGGTSLGFDFSITVAASTGTVVVSGYLATAVSTAGTAQTVPVFVFVDLGTTTAPTVNSLTVVFNQCASATACP
jgi:hypothetical protein